MWRNIDFLPDRIKTQRTRRASLIRQGYLLAICLGALLVLGYVRQMGIRSAKGELAVVQERGENMQRQLEIRKSLEHQLAELMLLKKIDDTLGSRVVAVDVLAELNRLVPESVALTEFNLETVKVCIPIQSIETDRSSSRVVSAGGKKMTREVQRFQLILTGIAPSDVDIANFIGQLSASPLFEDVHMGYAKDVVLRGRTAREFQASCHVVR